ncbi:MAG TPA: S-layer homology domain-containing protein [Acidimicrobiales bacterium]|nr:S-layer homology domain-containing protein [Acidimicrobiales bacterium]
MNAKQAVARGAVAALLMTVVVSSGVAHAATPPPPPDTSSFCQNVPDQNPFTDVGPGTHHDNILCLAAAGITQGNTPTTYDPSAIVRRDQMATFIARSIDEMNRLAKPGHEFNQLIIDEDDDDFWDDVPPGSTHHQNIGRLFEANIVNGTDSRTYNPSGAVTRAQMATFVNRSEEYLTGKAFTTSSDFFTDDEGNTHEDNVNGVASVGIAQGETATTYGPDDGVTREQMASFLIRWFAYHENRGDIDPLPPNTGPDLETLSAVDVDHSFTFNQGDQIMLSFANGITSASSITLTDGFNTTVTLTDDKPTPNGVTAATFAVSDDGTTLTVTPTAPVVWNSPGNRASGFSEAVTLMNASGISDADTNVEWNPDNEPVDQVRVDLF